VDGGIGILDVVQRQARHPEHNTIQVGLTKDVWSDNFVHICRAHNSDSATMTYPGICMNHRSLSCTYSILWRLPAYVKVASINHLHIEIKSGLDATGFTNLFTPLRQFTSVTFLKLQCQYIRNLTDLLGPCDATNVFLPNLRCLALEILVSEMSRNVEIYTQSWKETNDILDVRARLGKPVHQLLLIGEWVSKSISITDVDSVALTRARPLVTELVDTRSYD